MFAQVLSTSVRHGFNGLELGYKLYYLEFWVPNDSHLSSELERSEVDVPDITARNPHN